MLETLATGIDPDASLGDVIDAAHTLGWGEQMGKLSLADLAEALLPAEGESSDEPPAHAEQEAASGEEEAHNDATPASTRGGRKKVARSAKKATSSRSTTATRGKAKKAAKATTTSKAKSKKATATTTVRGKKAAPTTTARAKKAAAKAGTTAKKSKKKSGLESARLRALQKKIDADEPMSLDEAAELLVPIVEAMGEATMQALEDATGIARRKLRFHIGQLVRNAYLQRHGMGRGTTYTVA